MTELQRLLSLPVACEGPFPVHCNQSTYSGMMLVAFEAQPPRINQAMEHAW